MAKHLIPEGFVLERPSVNAELPPGFVLEDGSPSINELSFGQSRSATTEEILSTPPDTGLGATEALLQGATFGFSDEIESLIAAGGATAVNAFRKFAENQGPISTQDPTFPENLSQARTEIRQEQKQFTKENPKTALALNVAGGLSTGVASINALRAVGAPITGIKSVLTAGAGLGGLSGAGFAEGDESLAGAIVEGAATGLAFGGLLSGVGAAGKALFRRLAPGVKNRISELAKASGLTPSEIATRLKALGPRAVIADVNDVFKRAADVAASRLGPTSRLVKELLRRDETQFGRIIEPIRKTLGGSAAQAKTINQLKDIRIKESSPLYEKAFKTVLQPTRKLVDLLSRPETKKAWGKAKSLGKSDPDVDINTLGSADTPSFRGWQDITEILSNRASALARKGKFKAAKTISRLRQSILDELDTQSPDFAQARALWSSTKRADDMVEIGGKFLKMSAGQIDEALSTMSASDKTFFRLGMGDAIEQRLAKAGDTTDIGRMFRNQAFRDKAVAAFPDKKSAVDFINTVKAETIKKATANAVGKGSQTQPRQVAQKQLEGGKRLDTHGGTVGFFSGLLPSFGKAKPGTVQELGELLLSQDQATQRGAIQLMAAGGVKPPLFNQTPISQGAAALAGDF